MNARQWKIALPLVPLALGTAIGAALMIEAVKRPWIKVHLLRANLLEGRAAPLDNAQERPQKVACPSRATTILIAGQSNAANQGEGKGAFRPNVFNFYDGDCYLARDPLLGATGKGGSVWSRLNWDGPVVLAPVAEGLTRIDEWRPGGRLWPRITHTSDGLRAKGLPVDIVIWNQGESDAMEATSPKEYGSSLRLLVDKLRTRVGGQLIISPASHCEGVTSQAIVSVQIDVAKEYGVPVGPNTDLLEDAYRSDGCHFNAKGLAQLAEMWRKSRLLPVL